MSLPHFTLVHASRLARWELVEDATGRVMAAWRERADALDGGAMERALGTAGGVVTIQARDGSAAETRTLPPTGQGRDA